VVRKALTGQVKSIVGSRGQPTIRIAKENCPIFSNMVVESERSLCGIGFKVRDFVSKPKWSDRQLYMICHLLPRDGLNANEELVNGDGSEIK